MKSLPEYVERCQHKVAERIIHLEAFGIQAEPGECLGSINLSAGQTGKLLKVLRRYERSIVWLLEHKPGDPVPDYIPIRRVRKGR